ncbi:phosphate ABC transporter substrate-binding protein [Haloarcula rubripromontorii]|uniref:PhnD/SsuA/transferrin family substrate-binding protein n=1 Tax=Haloarcula rubripromontorii TaxID=1705562 RepID=A0A0M9AIB3_9EURY|nr:substrate-binding domain-containing protein [Haloarcula rubripromontorii]KOX91435.1 phosphate ABC transporter substrate-binding protein [Haloarcula rubripromontorii]NLV08322.1 PhnD/SsuA/transferrin family substrate-binding protein [Haloarcula rubripromontorii]
MTDGNSADVGAGRTTSRRGFIIKSGVAAGALTGLAGCSSVLGDSGSSNTITMVLTPGTPADARRRYKPMQNLIEGEVGVDVEMQVPQDYSAIRPALESEQAEIGMDDITLISNPDLMDVYGTTVTGGSAFYFSMMVTNPDSGIDERTDIEGKTMAFADKLSTSGSIFAVYALKEAGLDVGDAPSGQPVDFEGSWSNHDIALEKVGNGEADAATTWGGNGIPHIAEDTELPDRVEEKSSFLDTMETETPRFRPFWWSFPIPKQPVYARATWDDPAKEEIGNVLLNSDQDLIEQYYPEDYNEEELPFTTLADTSMEEYEPVIMRLNDLGIELGE